MGTCYVRARYDKSGFEYIFAFEDYGGLPNEVKIFSYNEENEAVVERWNNTETSLTYLYCKTVGEVLSRQSVRTIILKKRSCKSSRDWAEQVIDDLCGRPTIILDVPTNEIAFLDDLEAPGSRNN